MLCACVTEVRAYSILREQGWTSVEDASRRTRHIDEPTATITISHPDFDTDQPYLAMTRVVNESDEEIILRATSSMGADEAREPFGTAWIGGASAPQPIEFARGEPIRLPPRRSARVWLRRSALFPSDDVQAGVRVTYSIELESTTARTVVPVEFEVSKVDVFRYISISH